jgi:uncharacterized protein HemX
VAESDKTALAWLVAVVFAGATALFAWQYARARSAAASLRDDYVQLQERLGEQEARNADLLSQVEQMQSRLDQALTSIESLRAQVESELSGAAPGPREPE